MMHPDAVLNPVRAVLGSQVQADGQGNAAVRHGAVNILLVYRRRRHEVMTRQTVLRGRPEAEGGGGPAGRRGATAVCHKRRAGSGDVGRLQKRVYRAVPVQEMRKLSG
jgi:hypothetical protein